MPFFLLGSTVLVLLALLVTAAAVALFAVDRRRSTLALRLVSTFLTATCGSGGVLALLHHVQQTGMA